MPQQILHSTREAHEDGAQQGSSARPKRSTLDPKLVSASRPQEFSHGSAKHPAVLAYQESHPRRTLINFGPYILLQTLGEGEFGKVKLGIHKDYGEEVAIKLIRRGAIDDEVRRAKVEREIDVLKTVQHPHIVGLYDVIETEKYIGIVLDFAKGGELFDHILAHKYLKEREAARIFAQLISGVNYLHEKKIVHRDLKLENLLLDKHRNVIITDFGFANRFYHRQDDLMATSCGSPCYAAPELVISEGLYVGSAVDVWSCGVILYAMLSGYLPFDDDPTNPDGDNINLLYRYILATPLTFPDQISLGARNLLSAMLVPDPGLRCTLRSIMEHAWLADYQPLFERSQSELETMARQQQLQKRQVARNHTKSRSALQEQGALRRLAGMADGVLPKAQESSSITRLYNFSDGHSEGQAVGPVLSLSHPSILSSPSNSERIIEVSSSNQDREKRRAEIGQDEERYRSDPSETPIESSVQRHRHTIQLEYREETVTSPFESSHPISSDEITLETGKAYTSNAGSDACLSWPAHMAQASSLGNDADLNGSLSVATVVARPIADEQEKVGLRRANSKGVQPDIHRNDLDESTRPPSPSNSRIKLASARMAPTSTGHQLPPIDQMQASSVRTTSNQQLMHSEKRDQKTPKAGTLGSSTSAARKVMDWFRKRSQRQAVPNKETGATEAAIEKDSLTHGFSTRKTQPILRPFGEPAPVLRGPKDLPELNLSNPVPAILPQRSELIKAIPTRSPIQFPPTGLGLHTDILPVHRGLIDQKALTTKHPEEILSVLESVLTEMNIKFKHESRFRLRCVHPGNSTSEIARQTTADNPKVSMIPFFRDVMAFKGTQARHGEALPERLDITSASHDAEIRFSIEVTRLQNLAGLHSIDVKRIRGNAWNYKDIHQSIIERCNFSH